MSEFYEDADVLSEYLLFHYGDPETILPWSFGPSQSVDFPRRIAHQFQHLYPEIPASSSQPTRALDLGCAVGRSTFELTRWFDEVVGIDYSQAFIHAASRLKQEGSLQYRFRIQGSRFEPAQCTVPEGCDAAKTRFIRGDAMNLATFSLGEFDLILASNLICRLPDPSRFLQGLASSLRPGGMLILSTPYTYLESFTPPSLWLGGREDGPSAEEAVTDVLSLHFTQLEAFDLPMLIREHARKFQWTVCHASAWKKI
ncbi:MAG: putative 4-mercaptohistidine N1-methyltransferase [Puniceicoccaceae bacterium]